MFDRRLPHVYVSVSCIFFFFFFKNIGSIIFPKEYFLGDCDFMRQRKCGCEMWCPVAYLAGRTSSVVLSCPWIYVDLVSVMFVAPFASVVDFVLRCLWYVVSSHRHLHVFRFAIFLWVLVSIGLWAFFTDTLTFPALLSVLWFTKHACSVN